MPNSISEKEIALANSIDIPSFMKSKGIDLKRVGGAYEWESPEGKVSIRGNQWYSCDKRKVSAGREKISFQEARRRGRVRNGLFK